MRRLLKANYFCENDARSCKGCPVYRPDDGWCDRDVLFDELGIWRDE